MCLLFCCFNQESTFFAGLFMNELYQEKEMKLKRIYSTTVTKKRNNKTRTRQIRAIVPKVNLHKLDHFIIFLGILLIHIHINVLPKFSRNILPYYYSLFQQRTEVIY